MVNATPRPVYPPRRTRYPFYRRLVGLQGRSGWVKKISPAAGFDPRTMQPVAIRYTDYAIPAHPIYKCVFLVTERSRGVWFSLRFSTDIDRNRDKSTQCVFCVAVTHRPQNLNHQEEKYISYLYITQVGPLNLLSVNLFH